MRFEDRACVPRAAESIMTARTLANSHPTLLTLLRPGRRVLDVGCGPGTLTAEIARRVSPGLAVGLDLNPEMIALAEDHHGGGHIANLGFVQGDIRQGRWREEFDIVNAARTLQWIPDVGAALDRMVTAAAPGGRIVVLDFDHTGARWTPPPPGWASFYAAFLAWRADGDLDNALAPRLPALLSAAGLLDVVSVPQVTTVRAGEPDFFRAAGIWRLVADSRGRQMVNAGALSEARRQAAFDGFTAWMQDEHATQVTVETCVIGRKP